MNKILSNHSVMAIIRPGAIKDMFKKICAELGIDISSKNVGDVSINHGKLVTASATQKFFLTAVVTDQTNFSPPEAMRAKDEPVFITQLRLCSGVNASVQATDWVPGLTTPELQNGTFQLMVDGVNVIPPMSLTAFNGDGTESSQLGVYNLAMPFLVKDQVHIQAIITFSVTPATANTNVMVEMYGIGAFS